MLRLSLILPTYQEEGLTASLERLAAAVRPFEQGGVEILVVDDSDAATRRAIEAWAAAWAEREPHIAMRVLEGPHSGKGAAVRVGALASRGNVVFVMDADLPIPLGRIADFLEHIEAKGADVVIGERPMGRNAADPVRFVLSRALFAFQRFVVFQSDSFADTQCGFKAFRGEVIRRFAGQQVVAGGMYDIEYLYLARQEGLRVERVAVVPNAETRPSKINVKRAMLQDPQDLLRVKWRGIRGGYKRG